MTVGNSFWFASAKYSGILVPDGSVFGNMTGFGGLASAFDGNKDKGKDDSAYVSGSNKFVGKSFTTAQVIIQCIAYAVNGDQGTFGWGGTTNATTLRIFGKNGAPSSFSDGTELGGLSAFTPAAGQVKTIDCSGNSTAFTHNWLVVNQNNDCSCCQLEYFV